MALPSLLPMPGATEPLVLDAGLMNPVWLGYFKRLHDVLKATGARALLDMPGVDTSTPITDGQVLIYSAADQKMKPGAN